jgi:hypothetical protein
LLEGEVDYEVVRIVELNIEDLESPDTGMRVARVVQMGGGGVMEMQKQNLVKFE